MVVLVICWLETELHFCKNKDEMLKGAYIIKLSNRVSNDIIREEYVVNDVSDKN
jgi:hypothetical protein